MILPLSITILSLLQTAHAQSPNGAQEPLIETSTDAISTFSDNCHNACTALVSHLGDGKSFYNSLPPNYSTLFFSARQHDITPACIIRPTSAQEVSSSLSIIVSHSCHFAVKSGGHANFQGASNADGGVTIDLVDLNEKTVLDKGDEEGKGGLVRLGTGNRWGNVYQWLEERGLMVVGGRDGGVGVGGFTLGGGISAFSVEKGWAADNVANYEVVLSNSTIAQVNPATHPDLYWALRGGGGHNFGIVTRFDFYSFPFSGVWGGQTIYLFSDVYARRAGLGLPSEFSYLSLTRPLYSLNRLAGPIVSKIASLFGYTTDSTSFISSIEAAHLDAFDAEKQDPYSHFFISYIAFQKYNLYMGYDSRVNVKKVVNPPFLHHLQKLNNVYTSNAIRNISHIGKEMIEWNARGDRQIYAGITIKPSAMLLSKALDIWLEEIEPLADVEGALPSIMFQPPPARVNVNGGNCMGFSDSDGPLIIYSIQFRWYHQKDDELVHSVGKKIIDRVEATAKEMELHHPFIYMNYANISQDVIGSYGEENRNKLREVKKRYDPQGIWDNLWSGYYSV